MGVAEWIAAGVVLLSLLAIAVTAGSIKNTVETLKTTAVSRGDIEALKSLITANLTVAIALSKTAILQEVREDYVRLGVCEEKHKGLDHRLDELAADSR